jgi:hypothetical protein
MLGQLPQIVDIPDQDNGPIFTEAYCQRFLSNAVKVLSSSFMLHQRFRVGVGKKLPVRNSSSQCIHDQTISS